MSVEIQLPEKYEDKLADVEAVEPTIRDQIEVEVLPQVLRLINEAHGQLPDRESEGLIADSEE